MRNPAHHPAVALICAFAAVLTAGALCLDAQQSSPNQSGFVAVTVTDPGGRFVNGLKEENFAILENGFPRPVTYFSIDPPIALAIISESPLPMRDTLKPEDELIQASSLSGALRQLAASKNQRKAIIVTMATDVATVPAGIQVVHVGPSRAFMMVQELRNQYLLRFQSTGPAARIEVVLRQLSRLPPLKPVWTDPF
jgi:hypothetical protein